MTENIGLQQLNEHTVSNYNNDIKWNGYRVLHVRIYLWFMISADNNPEVFSVMSMFVWDMIHAIVLYCKSIINRDHIAHIDVHNYYACNVFIL